MQNLRSSWTAVAIVSTLLSCGPAGSGDGGAQRWLPAAPSVLDELGHFGVAHNGKPLVWARSYVVDLTGDGQSEIVIVTSYDFLLQLTPSPIRTYAVRGGTLVEITETLFPGGAPSAVFNRELVFGDFNNDGYPDLFLSNHGTEAFRPHPGEQNRLYLSDGLGHLIDSTDTHLPTITDFSHGSAAADIDGDGRLEIFVNNLGGGETPWSYLMRQDDEGRFSVVADARFDGAGILPDAIMNRNSGYYATFVDMTDDGSVDLFLGPIPNVGEHSGWKHVLLLNDGTGRFTLADPDRLPNVREFQGFTPSAARTEDVLVGDITGDGRDDLVSFVRYGDFQGAFYTVFVNNGDGTFSDETEARLPGQTFEPLVTSIPEAQLVDLNGNGHLDLLARAFDFGADPGGSATRTWAYLNDGTGHFEALPEVGAFRPKFAVLDVNGDGVMDLVTEHRDWTSMGESYLAISFGRDVW